MAMKPTSILEKLYPAKEIVYNGVVFKITALPGRRVPDLAEMFGAAGFNLLSRDFSSFRDASWPLVLSLLNECVKVDGESISAEELPSSLYPELIGTMMDLSLPLGNWKALGVKLGLIRPQSVDPNQTNSETTSET